MSADAAVELQRVEDPSSEEVNVDVEIAENVQHTSEDTDSFKEEQKPAEKRTATFYFRLVTLLQSLFKEEQKPAEVKRTATFFSGLVTMLMSLLGAGILSLPISVTGKEFPWKGPGYVVGPLLIIFGGCVTAWSLVMCVKAAAESKKYSFPQLTEHYLGKNGSWVLIIMFVLTLVLACCSFASGFTNSVYKQILYFSDCTPRVKESTLVFDCHAVTRELVLFLGLLCMFPFFMVKEVSKLSITSTAAAICLFCGIIYLVVSYVQSQLLDAPLNSCPNNIWILSTCGVEYPLTNVCKNTKCTREAVHPTSSMKPEVWGIMEFWGVLIFAFFCHYNILSVYHELKNREHIWPIIYISVLGFGVPLYILVGVIGSIMFGTQTEDNIFDNVNSLGGRIAAILVGFTTLLKFPLCFNPTATMILEKLHTLESPFAKKINWEHFVTRAVCNLFLLMIIYPMALYASLLTLSWWNGIVACAGIGFFFPAAFFIAQGQLSKKEGEKTKAKSFSIQGYGLLACITLMVLVAIVAKIASYVYEAQKPAKA